MKLIIRRVIGIYILIAYNPMLDLYAQPEAFEINSVNFNTDQDILGPENEDRNYTMGLEITATFSKHFEKNGCYYILPWLRRKVDRLLGFEFVYTSNAAKDYLSSLSLIGSGFTPLRIDLVEVDSTDRPYGSILGLGSTRITTFNEDPSEIGEDLKPPQRFAVTNSFFIGILGLNIAKNVQSHIHKNHWFGSTRPIPLGWHNQISNGGEPTFLYNVSIISPLITCKNSQDFKLLESTLEGASQMGYYTNLSMALYTKFGKFDSEYWYNNNMLLSAGQMVKSRKKSCLEWNFYFSLRARYVVYNALLQGQFKKSNFELSSSEISRLILEASFGISANLYNRININFSPFSLRTAEFKSAGRNHVWGTLGLGVRI